MEVVRTDFSIIVLIHDIKCWHGIIQTDINKCFLKIMHIRVA